MTLIFTNYKFKIQPSSVSDYNFIINSILILRQVEAHSETHTINKTP